MNYCYGLVGDPLCFRLLPKKTSEVAYRSAILPVALDVKLGLAE